MSSANQTSQLALRLRELFFNGHWIANTNFQEQFDQTNFQQACQKPFGFNSVAALCYHITYYLNGLVNAFESGELNIRDKESFLMPPIQSEKDWQELKDSFLINAENFCRAVEQMEDSQLNAPFILPQYGSLQRNIEAVIEHGYYHLGQISLIRKCLNEMG